MDKLAELLRQGADKLVNLPTQAQRFVTNPQAFVQLLTGKNALPRETGFAASATGLPPEQGTVLDPNYQAYMQGYEQGEPVSFAAMAAPAAMPVAKALAPKAGQMAEQYMVNQGFMPAITPSGPSRQMSEFVPNVKAGEEMIVTHNLSPEKLYAAERLGGMPVPSLAISKISEPLTGFGDITLVGSKEMAVPSKTNLAFRSDAYTARKPAISYEMDYKSEKKFKDLFSDLTGDLPRIERDFGSIFDDFSRAKDSTVMQAKFLKENNLLPKRQDFAEDWQHIEAIQKTRQANQNAYDDWFDSFTAKLPDEGVNIKERIFRGYTPSGNRKYAQVNLENIVKEMKGGAGSEGFNYGVGNLRAIATPRFKKFDDILKDRDKLVSKADFEPIKKQATDNYIDLVNRLRNLNKGYSADDALLEAVENKNLNNLTRIYGEVPESLRADIGMFIDGLKKMPTEYFEIKPQRAVSIGEFKGAIVPSDLPAKAQKILEKSGIKEVYRYADEAERKQLLKKYGKEMFAGIPALPLAMPTDEAKAKTRKDILEEQIEKVAK